MLMVADLDEQQLVFNSRRIKSISAEGLSVFQCFQHTVKLLASPQTSVNPLSPLDREISWVETPSVLVSSTEIRHRLNLLTHANSFQKHRSRQFSCI